MLRIAIVVATATAALTTTPLATLGKAEAVKMAQGVDVQIERERDDGYYRDRYRYDGTVPSASARVASPSVHGSAAAQ
jgi:hypothetical protein